MKKVLVLHGPNLNLLGSREPHIYGTDSLQDINSRLSTRLLQDSVELDAFQSNFEGELIERIHSAAASDIGFIVINPGAFTHTSIALRDALLSVNLPFIEVHLSNIFAREPFRQHSYLSDRAIGIISGLGAKGYEFAVEYALNHIKVNYGSQKSKKTN